MRFAHKISEKDIWFKVRRFVLDPDVWMWALPFLLIVANVGLAWTGSESWLSKATDIVLPWGVYALLVSFTARPSRTVWLMLPFMILNAFQIVLLYLYGESIIAIDMFTNVVTTSVTEAGELLGNLKTAIVTVLCIYVPVIAMAVYFAVRKRRCTRRALLGLRRTSWVAIAAGVAGLLACVAFVPGFNAGRQMFPYNVIDNLVTAVKRTGESLHYHDTSATFSYQPTMTRDRNERELYVLVIGETSRADNWQLFGYGRETNPRLSHQDNLIAFPKVLTEINTTHKAVPLMLSYLTAENFGDSVAHTKSIFSAFNDLGYQTAFLSNQRRNHSYIDYYGQEAQTAVFLTDNGGPQLDRNLIKRFDDLVENSPSNKIFVVLHTYGSHFEYRKRYEGKDAHFTPDNNSAAGRGNRKQLLNAYDNTIRYCDSMLADLIQAVDSMDVRAALMFVSDHGEDIFDDDRERFLHSSPTPTYWQIHVPMIVWYSDEFAQGSPQMVANMQAVRMRNISSSRSVFHTMLDLAQIRSPYYDAEYSLASPRFKETPRRYLNDYNESVPLSQSGLKQEDFEQFRRKGISY